MYNLEEYKNIILFLQSQSNIFEDKNKEYVMFCPFCDDATRKQNPDHGHLYVAKHEPVFNCFRCGTSGHIIKLLTYLEFDDTETIKKLSEVLNFNFKKNNFNFKQKNVQKHIFSTFKNKIINYYLNFKKENPDFYNQFLNYMNERIGNVNLINFFVIPIIHYKFGLCCQFYNSLGEKTSSRIITNNSNLRYLKDKNVKKYFIQNYFLLDEFDEFTFLEGPFDLINSYLYNNEFNGGFYFAINGKYFNTKIENFIINELMMGSYKINIILDDDDNYKKLEYSLYNYKYLNSNIQFDMYLPTITKDVGDFFDVELIKSI